MGKGASPDDGDSPRRSLSFQASQAIEHIKADERERTEERRRRENGEDVPPRRRWTSKGDKIVGPIFYEAPTRRRARCFGLAFVACSILSHIIGIFNFRLFKQQSKAIEGMDVDKFYVMFPRWLGWHIMGMVLQAITQYSIWEIRMMVQWRTGFRLINALYSSNTFYHLSVSTEPGARAPEQLMCEEAFVFVEASVNQAQNLLREIPDLFIKMYLLFEYRAYFLLYAMLSLPVLGIVMGYSAKLTIPLTHVMLKTHADINFVLARIQNNAEQIALFKGGSSELRRWEQLLDTYRGCLLRQELLVPMIGIVSGGVISAILAPLAWALYNDILDGGVAVAEALNYFRMVGAVQSKVGSLGIIVGMAMFQEVRARQMCHLLETSETYQQRDEIRRQRAEEGKDSPDLILIHEQGPPGSDEPELEMKDVVVTIPVNGRSSSAPRTLLENVSLKLHSGESMLIVGGTGVGKSALLLSIHGLWYSGQGQVRRCPNSAMFCVPQRPYMFRASLRDNLMYPEIWRETVDDSKLQEALQAVNLASALRHYDLGEVQPWNSILSLGQQQRLAIARGLLMTNVRLLLLDEATSALDMRNERLIYNLLKKRVPCYVSVGHRPSVREYHTHVTSLEFSEELTGPETQHDFRAVEEHHWKSQPLESSSTEIQKEAEQSTDEVPAFWSVTAGGGVGGKNECVPSVEERKDSPKAKEKCLVGPDMSRRMGGLPLMRRATFDVVLPLSRQRHFWLPVLLSLGLLALSVTVLGVWMGQLMTPIMAFQDVLRLRNRDLAWDYLWRIALQAPFLGVLGYLSAVGSLLLTTMLFIETKRGLARRYLDSKSDTYYHLHMSRLVANPGTRISNFDTQSAIRWLADLVSTLTNALGLIGILARLAQQTSGKVFIAYLQTGGLLLFLLFHSLFSNYNGWLTEIMQLHSNVIHTRENAEAVALLNGSESERIRAYETIDSSITPGSKYVWQKSFFWFLLSLWYNEFLELCLMCVYNPMTLMGLIALGQSETSKGLFRYASGFSSSLSGHCIGKVEGQLGMERLWELMVAMTAIRSASSADLSKNWGGDIALVDEAKGNTVLEFKNLSLKTPVQVKSPSRTLVREVSLALRLGETLLIAGESGIGKSSLVRAVAGLWRNGGGEIRRPPWRRSFFIAQRPYMCIGTLREQLLYPRIERRDVDDERLIAVLKLVDLDHLLAKPGLGPLIELFDHEEEQEASSKEESGRLLGRVLQRAGRMARDAIPDRSTVVNVRKAFKSFVRYEPEQQRDMNWANSLSLGEIQRISFARLLLQEDLHLVILDEATSGLSPEGEETMYNLIKAHSSSYVSVAHRPQLRRFHQRVMVLEANYDESTGEPGPATCRDLPMPQYEAELADEDIGRKPDSCANGGVNTYTGNPHTPRRPPG